MPDIIDTDGVLEGAVLLTDSVGATRSDGQFREEALYQQLGP